MRLAYCESTVRPCTGGGGESQNGTMRTGSDTAVVYSCQN